MADTDKKSRSSEQPRGSKRAYGSPKNDEAKKSQQAREPTPPPLSPPRKRKRPTGTARINRTQIEEAQKKEAQREQAQTDPSAASASVSDFVKQHYNAVPERGREWRRTDSNIKGLRSYNNWVKSVLIKKYSPSQPGLKILDIGCGKGGDLQKWRHQNPSLYVGLDPADVSIQQASGRYREMKQKARGRLFHAEFQVKDCFGESLQDVNIVREAGFDKSLDPRWGGGGFDMVSMMFCMHYAFESEEKARMMLRNVAGSLKKGGKFIGVIPNSDIISARVKQYHKEHGTVEPSATTGQENGAGDDEDDRPTFADSDDDRPTFADSDDEWDPEKPIKAPKEESAAANSTQPEVIATASKSKEAEDKVTDTPLEWGNHIYKIQFPGKTPLDGIFRPPFGWKYFFYLAEAVETVPEYVVPWESFRGLAEDFNLELQYRKEFREVFEEEKRSREFAELAERMGVKSRNDHLLVGEEEMEAAAFYHAFCFYKV
jgi:mRNA (guanine-N7-)-methyltransferase